MLTVNQSKLVGLAAENPIMILTFMGQKVEHPHWTDQKTGQQMDKIFLSLCCLTKGMTSAVSVKIGKRNELLDGLKSGDSICVICEMITRKGGVTIFTSVNGVFLYSDK